MLITNIIGMSKTNAKQIAILFAFMLKKEKREESLRKVLVRLRGRSLRIQS
jgi:hypothetical protein